MRRVDQDLASAAAQMLPAHASHDRTLRTRYRTLRVMCHTSGLAATYAYAAAKSGDQNDLGRAYRQVVDGIGERLAWLEFLDGLDSHDRRAVLGRLGEMDTVQYMAASAQITALLGWLARLADAIIQDQPAEAHRNSSAS